MKDLEVIRASSRRAGILTIGGVLIVIASLFYSYFQLSTLEKSIRAKEQVLREYQTKIRKRKAEVEKQKKLAESSQKEAGVLRARIEDLKSTQGSLLDFLVSVTDKNKVSILGSDVNWQAVEQQLQELPAGSRKNAILNAILLAWKDVPFSMGKESISSGFDSPRFLRYVLGTVGVHVDSKKGESLSVTLMNRFEKTDTPKPGDLVFFKGQVGNFGFIIAAVADKFSEHVGIGTLQKVAPLQILRLGNINTPYFPLRGYYRVRYPDEK
uniref:Uncharacterized protein n=1 Tax=Candidatus Kentrum sp. DK TaxID=2126562 RepID=A0A450RTA0_9GAMM|nr:MAG: hypothetical protein BECKDK2373B_GA0170837_10013 [Candidatus Kentron sp. DK]